ncbi:phage antirepressor KilAC domain-containing protein [Clostridium sp.]|uniref:phage antirepressor KilAC domain-containing protein n=1 Tax=Clostridium sp. TaxID=1506 RepID=UPI00261DCB84|nr:phage antirepressor KilAC domain-containing protein [Clostridium sp.]
MEVKHKHKEGVQLFVNKELELEVRAIKNDDGSISLNAEDSAKGLGWTTVATSGNTVVRWNRVNKYISEFGSYPQVGTNDFIPESLFYLLAMKANNELAKKFQMWLATEVLPSMRKHGMYATDELLDNPDLLIAAATKLKEERAARLEAEKKVENLTLINAQQNQRIGELQPKATYYDLILQNNSLLAISAIAKDYGMSGTSLNKKLHELGVQYKLGEQWLLYAKYHDKGYTFSKTQNYSRTDGSQGSKLHTYWTQKGRLFIYDLLKQNDILPLIERGESEVI